jgi:hypothetical protein
MTVALNGTPARPLVTGPLPTGPTDGDASPQASSQEPDHDGFMRVLEQATKIVPARAPEPERPSYMSPIHDGGK